MVQTAKNWQHNLTWMDFWLEELRLRLNCSHIISFFFSLVWCSELNSTSITDSSLFFFLELARVC